MSQDERGPWYLITALIIGISAGLFYAWVISSVEYIDTAPVSLRLDQKDAYRSLVAAAYASTGDAARAQARLTRALGDENPQTALAEQAGRMAQNGAPQWEIDQINALASALAAGLPAAPLIQAPPLTPEAATQPPSATPAAGQDPAQTAAPVSLLSTPAPETQEGTPAENPGAAAAAPSLTPLPTRTPTPGPSAPFVLKEQAAFLCDRPRSAPLIIVEAYDAAGEPLPGVQVFVYWQGGEDRFYTGLKPELGLGYADFTMTPGTAYTVQLAAGGQPVTGLAASECESGQQERHWGAWKLIFTQP
jgi:hypothetical protein